MYMLCKSNDMTSFVNWIELPWPENLANTYTQHTETLNSCFDLIRSHQQCIPWSPPLEIEPATTDCKAETLQLSHWSISHISDAKLTSHWRCPWCNSYRHRKWTRQHKFKFWMRPITFHIALIPLGKVWTQLFSLKLWVNSRTDWVLQPLWGNLSRRRKTLNSNL